MRRAVLAVVLVAVARPAVAYDEAPLQSYTRVSPDQRFVFVFLTDPRNRLPSRLDPLADKYGRAGLYRNDGTTAPLWLFTDSYAREAWPASDGVHLVTQTEYVVALDGGRKCGNGPPDEAPNPNVLAVYANGKKVRDVPLGDLLDHVRFCRDHEPGWHVWLKAGRIDDAAGTFVVDTTAGTHREVRLVTGLPNGFLVGTCGNDGSGRTAWGPLLLGLVLAGVAVGGTAVVAVVFLRSRGGA